MRIAHVVSTFFPRVGGMGRVCADEAEALVKQGHEVTVFTLAYKASAGDADEDKKFPFTIARLKPWLKFGDAGLVPQLLGKLNKFDLVHLHYPFYGGAEWLAFVNTPFVITYHMDAQLRGSKFLIQKIYDAFWPKCLFARARRVIGVDTEHSKQLRFYREIKNKLTIIPNGVDTNLFRPAPASARELNLAELEGKKIILFAGNALPLKRLDLLLQAIKILNDQSAVLLVVGGGYEMDACKQMAKDLGVDKAVYFAGSVNEKAKMSAYYNLAVCLAAPSDYESFSLVIAEAMACGVPVVASDIAVNKNRLENSGAGLLFARGSAESLAEALKQILNMSEEKRKEMGQRGRDGAVEKYSQTQHLEKLLNLYAEVLNIKR